MLSIKGVFTDVDARWEAPMTVRCSERVTIVHICKILFLHSTTEFFLEIVATHLVFFDDVLYNSTKRFLPNKIMNFHGGETGNIIIGNIFFPGEDC